ncbi:hypothetical protein TNCV_2836241 [Trichonephila clavipes]|nr:hypothetical protein TNCV_2836241 [Trichonephila clavipes]
MTAQRYFSDILHPHVLSILPWFQGALFRHDEAQHTHQRFHRIKSTVFKLFFGLLDQDLSPIKHLCDKLRLQAVLPTSLVELGTRYHRTTYGNCKSQFLNMSVPYLY